MTRRRGVALLALFLVARPGPAFGAEDVDRSQAKEYFRAGAAAYAAGDYLAAIQALEAAYRITPLGAIAFSLAQAERRQYFVSREPARLLRAIELYRHYLRQEPQGGRRADATDALAQLEPLAVSVPAADGGEPVAAPDGVKTRVMVTSEAPGALVVLDGRAPVRSPLIAEVAPGTHSVEVRAPGFFSSSRKLVAVAGELVPIEVPLREQAPLVLVRAAGDVDVYVDGLYRGKAGSVPRMELTSGVHTFDFAKKGHRTETIRADFRRGSTRRIAVDLEHTKQRTLALVLFGASAATFVGGVAIGASAIEQERKAEAIADRREEENISPEDVAAYNDAKTERNRFRLAAAGSLAVSLGTFAAGMLLHELDPPMLTNHSWSGPRGARPPSLQVGFELGRRHPEGSLGVAVEF